MVPGTCLHICFVFLTADFVLHQTLSDYSLVTASHPPCATPLNHIVQWNELGKPTGNPRTQQTCAEYNPRREQTIMFKFRVGERGLSPGSLMTLGLVFHTNILARLMLLMILMTLVLLLLIPPLGFN